MKLTLGTLSASRIHRRVAKGTASKKAAVTQQPRILSAPRELDRPPVDPCDNSNDSGLGFEQPQEFTLRPQNVKFPSQEAHWLLEHSEAKRKKLDIKLDCDDVNDNFYFPEAMNSRRRAMPDSAGVLQSENGMYPCSVPERPETTALRSQDRLPGRGGALAASASRRLAAGGSVTLTSHLSHMSRNRKVYLQIVSQPEQQHRARYQTEGSRGAVKDRSGNGFPVIKLIGYDKPATLQVFIGTDVGRVAPHMFYQACRVSGKNSTPCIEKKIDGTVVIEVNFDPAKEMIVTCDCVGILKERNVDVEHRFPEHLTSRNKKKSTRCRMVFRTTITHPDGSNEVLQILSQPIACTQPPGVPEVCKRSLTSCVCTGGAELFILGKNFLKDTVVMFDQPGAEPPWRETVQPDKEFLQQTHLVCVVPPYRRCDIVEPVSVRLMVVSSGKTSEPHSFVYTPGGPPKQPVLVPERLQPCGTTLSTRIITPGMEMSHIYPKPSLGILCMSDVQSKPSTSSAGADNVPPSFVQLETSRVGLEKETVHPHIIWQPASIDVPKQEVKEKDAKRFHMMKLTPPPLLPLVSRRMAIVESEVIHLKTEVPDEHYSPEELKVIDLRMKPTSVVQPLLTVADLSASQAPSMVTLRQLVDENGSSSLPAQSGQSVEKFLLRLENKQTSVAQEDQKHGGFSMVSLQDSQSTVKQDESGQPHVSLLSDGFQPHTSPVQPTLLTTLMPSPMPVVFPQETSTASTLITEQAEKKLILDMTKNEVSNMLETSLMTTSVNPESGNLSIGTCHIAQTSLLPAPHTSSLDVLVSSAIGTHVQDQTASTEKLDAFVNSTVDSHLMNAAPVRSDAALQGQNFANATATDSQNLALNMLTMGPSVSSETVSNFELAALDSNAQSSRAELLTGVVVSSALDEHLLATTKPILTDSPQVSSSSSVDNSNMNHVLLQSSSHPSSTLLSHPVPVEPTVISTDPRTSPIALKNMILNTAAASLEAGPACSSRTSPIAIKAMILDSHMKAMGSQMMMVEGDSGVLEDGGTIPTLLPTDAKSAVSQVPAMPQPSPAIQPNDSSSQAILENIYGAPTTTQNYTPGSDSISTFVPHAVTRITEKDLGTQSSVSGTEVKLETSAATMTPSLSQQNPCMSSVDVPVSIPAKGMPTTGSIQKKPEEGEVPQELTQMSENDLLSYINPSCFDQV